MSNTYPQMATKISKEGDVFTFEMRSTDARAFKLPDMVVETVNTWGKVLECICSINDDVSILLVKGPEIPIRYIDWLFAHSLKAYEFVMIENSEE